MQIEDIARICLTPRRTLEQKAHCTICDRVLGQIIIDDQHILALTHKILTQRTPRVGSNVLERRGIRSRGGYDDRIFHGARFPEHMCQSGDRGDLLSDRHIDADDILVLLIEDGIRCDRCLARLAVADDQLSLSAADGEHGINGKDARLQRLTYGSSVHDARCALLDRIVALRFDQSGLIDRISQRIDDTSQKSLSHGHARLFSGPDSLGAGPDPLLRTEQDAADLLFSQVLHHSAGSVLKHKDLPVKGAFHTLDDGDSVADPGDEAHFLFACMELKITDLALQCDEQILHRIAADTPDLLPQLSLASGLAEIKFAVADPDDKARGERRILLKIDRKILHVKPSG